MEHEIHLAEAVPQLTAVVRFRAGQRELATLIPAACGEVWTFIRSSGHLRGGRHLAVYCSEADGQWDIECGAEVDRPFASNGRVVCSATPAGPVAVAVHWGPYDRLGETHDAVLKWCADNGHAKAGPFWEVYDHWTDDPSQLRTDVYYLLRAAKV